MKNKFLILLFLVVLSVSTARADTGEMIGGAFNAIGTIPFTGTFISWALLLNAIFKRKKPNVYIIVILGFICCVIGLAAILVGLHWSGNNEYKEDGQNFIIWGWVIIIFNILAIVVAIYIRVSRKVSSSNNVNVYAEKISKQK